MTKKSKILIATPFTLLALLATITTASAHFGGFGGRGLDENLTPDQVVQKQQDMFQHQADITGLSLETVKDAWAEGKTMQDLIEENGLDQAVIEQKMREQRQAQIKEHLDTLVSGGVITKSQADQRLSWMQNNDLKGGGAHRQRHMKFMH